jgi:YesN/AraC family two-component response regulator
MMKKLEIVVVDDEEPITEVIKTYIECIDSNINVHTFNDSIAAKYFVTHNSLDVLITDYKMPLCDGIQLMEAAGSKENPGFGIYFRDCRGETPQA